MNKDTANCMLEQDKKSKKDLIYLLSKTKLHAVKALQKCGLTPHDSQIFFFSILYAQMAEVICPQLRDRPKEAFLSEIISNSDIPKEAVAALTLIQTAIKKDIEPFLLLAPEFPYIICALYEIGFAEKKTLRKKHGAYYTPKEVADFMLSESLKLITPSSTITTLDPACGAGIFLISAIKKIPLHQIFGVDKDPLAIEVARLSLLLMALSLDSSYAKREIETLALLSRNIICGDAIISKSGNLWRQYFPDVTQDGGFSLIIGNPPYGISRDDKITPEDNVLMKKEYSYIRNGKINKYMAFMAKAFSLLREGGVCSLIVPNSWLGIKSGEKLREFFLNNSALHSISTFKTPVFEDPGLEAVVYTAIKGKPQKNIKISIFDSHYSFLRLHTFNATPALCLKRPGKTIPLIWADGLETALSSIHASTIPLSSTDSPFLPKIALQPYAAGKGEPPQSKEDVKNRIYDCNSRNGRNVYRFLKGADVLRYAVNFSGGYLKYGPWLADPQKLDYYTCQRIILREIINPPPYALNCAFTDKPYLYTKSILHIIGKTQDLPKEWFMGLLGILNSRLGSFIILFQGRKSQRRLFPKIVNEDLKSFPIPRNYKDALFSISKAFSESRAPSTLEQQRIDNAVFECYGIGLAGQNAIEEYFQNYKKALLKD
ncbi:MAG: hypothetical protein D6808_00740 [Candidatus Dadabacteria bacterium]|nr:MAG: hypothetical protein D6808_00740 [Candidatus Dadabacteria bacterium]